MKVRSVGIKILLQTSVLMLASCSILPAPSSGKTYFLLPTNVCEAAPTSKHDGVRLSISNGTTNQLLLVHKILFSSDPLSRGEYQYSLWTESPGQRVPALISQALSCRGEIAAVTRDAPPGESDEMLSVSLVDFYHDTSTQPGVARVAIRAELSGPDRRLLRAATFHSEVSVRTFDARGAVEALIQGTAQVVRDVSDWVVAPPAPATASN